MSLDLYKNYKTVLSVNALIYCKGKILLIKRSPNKKVDPNIFSGIGGKVEPGEDFYTALIREVKEESGIDNLKSIRLFSVTQHPFPPDRCEWVNLYFTAKIDKQIAIDKSNDGEFYWLDPKQIDKYDVVYDLKKYIKILNKNPKAFIFAIFNHDKDGKLSSENIQILKV